MCKVASSQPGAVQGIHTLLISGSPFAGGKTEKTTALLYSQKQEQGIAADVLFVSHLSVAGCLGCNKCASLERDKTGSYDCILTDDMQMVAQKLMACAELMLVTPVFFSGVPSQVKAILDRLQPFFWSRRRGGEKRPFDLVVLGEGGDPYGYEALVSEASSSLAMAGFKLREIYDCVGRVEDGELL